MMGGQVWGHGMMGPISSPICPNRFNHRYRETSPKRQGILDKKPQSRSKYSREIEGYSQRG
jgi:hypothetical protein